jgi:hypothetical protein
MVTRLPQSEREEKTYAIAWLAFSLTVLQMAFAEYIAAPVELKSYYHLVQRKSFRFRYFLGMRKDASRQHANDGTGEVYRQRLRTPLRGYPSGVVQNG